MENQQTQQPSENVIRKIQKLLALATGGNNSEAEAASAMAAAQRMLAQYNLDYHMVQKAQVEGGTNEIEQKREKTTLDNFSAMYQWQRDLWKAIAEANFCWYWTVDRRVESRFIKGKMIKAKRHMLLGAETNILSVRMMGEYLCSTIERLLPYPKNECLSRSAISWRAGCADRLIERIHEQTEKLKETPKTDESSTALSILDVFDREYIANYDAAYGKGAHAAMIARHAKWDAEDKERRAKRAEEAQKAEAEKLEALKNETPEQKARREKKEEAERLKAARRDERWRRSYYNEQRRAAARVDHEAYRAGAKTGDTINLSKQTGAGAPTPRLEKGGK